MDGKPSRLTARLIAGRALELIDADGAEALTMRRLGDALGVGQMACYNYFRSKDALLEAVTQVVLAEVDQDPPDEALPWRPVVERIMRSVREAGLRHPHAVPFLERYAPRTLPALAFVETGFRAFRRAGFDDTAIARSYSALAAYSFGTLAVEVNNYFAGHPAVLRQSDDLDAESMARLLPHITKVGPTLAALDPATQFEYGLKLILDGFDVQYTAPTEVAQLRAELARTREQLAAALDRSTTAA